MCGKNFNVGCYTQIVHPNLFISDMLLDTIDACQLFGFTDFDLAWGSQGQCKANPIGLIFLHSFHLIRMKCDVVMKQLKLNTLRLLLNKI